MGWGDEQEDISLILISLPRPPPGDGKKTQHHLCSTAIWRCRHVSRVSRVNDVTVGPCPCLETTYLLCSAVVPRPSHRSLSLNVVNLGCQDSGHFLNGYQDHYPLCETHFTPRHSMPPDHHKSTMHNGSIIAITPS